MPRVPAVTRHLARMSARTLDMQSVYSPRDLGHQVGPLARKNQCLDEQDDPVGPHHAVDYSIPVGLWCTRASPCLFGTLGNVEHVATRRLDEQRLFAAEVVGDLARKGIGRAGDSSDGGAVEAVRLEERACCVEEAGTHLLASSARRTHAVSKRGGMGGAEA